MSKSVRTRIPKELKDQLERLRADMIKMGFSQTTSLVQAGRVAARSLEQKELKVIEINKYRKRNHAKTFYELKI
jgi:hypothetical protein